MPNDEYLPAEHFATTADGARICYELSGTGFPVLAIGGSGSTSMSFSRISPLLSRNFTFINYDRRGTLRSSGEVSLTRYIAQQTDDIIAALDHAGFGTVAVFATCGGTSIAFDLLARYPERVTGLVAHEPLTVAILPDAAREYEYYASWLGKAEEIGHLAAREQFHKAHRIPFNVALRAQPEKRAEFIFTYEVRPMVEFVPDLEAVRKSGSAFVIGASKENIGSSFAFARTPPLYVEALDADLAVFPGYHASYFEHPQSFAAVLTPELRKVIARSSAKARQ